MRADYFDFLMEILKKTQVTADIPVASIILDSSKAIVSVGWNTRQGENLISAHAEINAINELTKKMKSLNLENCTLITTLEPCQMCYGAIKQARIKKVEYLLDSQKYGINNNFSINDIDLQLIKTGTPEQEKKYRQILEIFFTKFREDKN